MSEPRINEFSLALDALRRHRNLFALTFAVCMIIVLLTVVLLPSKYRSAATILIESQEIPRELIPTTVTGMVEERLKTISQITLSRANLLGIIDRLDLYREARGKLTSEELVETMRKDISIDPIQADVQTSSGRPSVATIAFSLSYSGREPAKVLQATNTLVSLFLEENYKNREAKASTTYEFLEQQLAEISEEVNKTEAAIAAFKEKHYDALPTMMQHNLMLLDRIEREIQSKREQLRSLNERKIYLEGQLATVEPHKSVMGQDGKLILSPEEELKSLYNKYASLQATHSEKHPDMVKTLQKIASLEQSLGRGGAGRKDALSKNLSTEEKKLAELRARYADAHPEVIASEKKIASLRRQLAGAAGGPASTRAAGGSADNPAWITLNTQLRSAELEIASESKNLENLEQRAQDYLSRIETAPKVEREYLGLQRNYSTCQMKYQETHQKLMLAKEARGLEEQRVGERLTLVDPPVLPEKPASPPRGLILLAGCFFSLCLGAGAVAARESTDSTVHNSHGIAKITSLPVLASIPYLPSEKERMKKFRHRRLAIGGGLGLLLIAVVLVHVHVMPLDVFAYSLFSKISARI